MLWLYHTTGSLVLDEELAGKLYVKKVWIGDLKEENIVAAIDLNKLVS